MILVTGASGFIGSRIVREARDRGISVIAVMRRSGGYGTTFENDPNVECIYLDLSEEASRGPLESAISRVDAVVHCAAALQGNDAKHQRDTISPTSLIIEAINGTGKQQSLILIGSLAVYDYKSLPLRACLDEATPFESRPDLRDAYCRAKIAQERMVIDAARVEGLNAWILRPGVVYDENRLPISHVGFLKSGLLLVVGGDIVMPVVHVDNVASAAVRAATISTCHRSLKAKQSGTIEFINLVDDKLPSQWDWAKKLVAAGACRRVIVLPRSLISLTAEGLSFLADIFPNLIQILPEFLKSHSYAARFRPLNYTNRFARIRLQYPFLADCEMKL